MILFSRNHIHASAPNMSRLFRTNKTGCAGGLADSLIPTGPTRPVLQGAKASVNTRTPPGDGGVCEFNVAATYFSTSVRGSIIGPLELNCRVRDGNGCDLQGKATTKAVNSSSERLNEGWLREAGSRKRLRGAGRAVRSGPVLGVNVID